MQLNLLEEDTLGFYLDVFQFVNWGVFDKKIYTMHCNKKSSLLTGANGSGKTTLVDAFLSLLVPPQQRFYNQSSGAENKKDRSEPSYVLGAYGNTRSDEYMSSVQQSLRSKESCQSILLGSFSRHDNSSPITLMQMRYFSSSGILQRVYCITRKSIALEEVQNAVGNFDRQGHWQKVMKEKFDTVFYGDSFPRYASVFSEIFGLKSNKALYLFSQTVGLKVLGNLNEFVRMHMFEAQDNESKFKELVLNYENLSESYKEIEKVQEQIALLTEVIKAGDAWQECNAKQIKTKNLKDTIPLWYEFTKSSLIKDTIADLNYKLNDVENKLKTKNEELNNLSGEIISLRVAIKESSAAKRIADIEHNLEIETMKLHERKIKLANYEKSASLLKITVPQTEKTFNKNIVAFDSLLRDLQEEKTELEIAISELYSELRKKKEEEKEIIAELESLGERSTNIPLSNDKIRSRICKAVRCSEKDILFVGELLQVKNESRDWEVAIEKLVHEFALTMLVPEDLHDAVTKYFRENNLNEHIIYFRTNEKPSLKNLPSEENSLLSKISIKKDSSFADWLYDYLSEHFNYLCTDKFKTFMLADKAVSTYALIKDNERFEKDDRLLSSDRRNFVLGWDNLQKRQALSAELKKTQSEIGRLENEKRITESDRSGVENKIRAVSELKNITAWDFIDIKTCVIHIDELNSEKDELLKANELQKLQARLTKLQNDEKSKQQEKESWISELAQLNQKIEDLQITQNTLILRLANYKNEFSEDEINEKILILEKHFNIEKSFKTLNLLESTKEKFLNTLDNELKSIETELQKLASTLRLKMRNLKSPTGKTLEIYPSWQVDVCDFEAEVEYLDDFRSFYDRLRKDDLPKYRKRFKEFFNSKITQDITAFSASLEDGEQMIVSGIDELNKSLQVIPYSKNPPTYIKLENKRTNDVQVKEFQAILRLALPDAASVFNPDDETEFESFKKIKNFINYVQENETRKKKVLDVRNWFIFGAMEYYKNDNSQKQYYEDSSSLSGGEKAKLAYTILASAIAFQFGLTTDMPDNSFRFVIIDEAFSKIDPENSQYAMELFKQMGLQLMVVTPMDKIHIVEDYVSAVHITESFENNTSHLLEMSIERYQEEKINNDKSRTNKITSSK